MALKWEEVKSLPEAERQALHDMARVSQIGASTRIENAVLTDAEVNWVDTVLSAGGSVDDKLSKDKERSFEEVAGCRSMLLLIYEQAKDFFPLTEASLRGLHQELLRFYPPASHYLGKYKTVTNSVVEKNHKSGEERVVFKTADPGPMTEAAMTDLVRWYNEALPKTPWTLVIACELVFRFLAVHPFQDGNGRISRGLFLASLLHSPDAKLAGLARYLPIDRQIERHRPQYYAVLQKCSGGVFRQSPDGYRMDYFLDFMIRRMREALENLDVCRRRYRALQALSPAASQVFECFKDNPEKRLQTQDLVELTGLPRRTVNHALSTLQASELIQTKGRGPGTRHQVVW